MIEITVREFLLKKLVSCPVFMEEPEEIPPRYIILEKVGGGKSNGLKSATIAIQSYGASLEDAAMLNEEVKEALEDIDNQDPISSAELNSDYNFTDTETHRYRYQAVYDIIYY
jgi:hypothetical protein